MDNDTRERIKLALHFRYDKAEADRLSASLEADSKSDQMAREAIDRLLAHSRALLGVFKDRFPNETIPVLIDELWCAAKAATARFRADRHNK